MLIREEAVSVISFFETFIKKKKDNENWFTVAVSSF